jgi:hypothetical protein
MSWGAQSRSKDAKTPSAGPVQVAACPKTLNWIAAQSSNTRVASCRRLFELVVAPTSVAKKTNHGYLKHPLAIAVWPVVT